MVDNQPSSIHCHPQGELRLAPPTAAGIMGGDAESDKSAIDSNPTSPRLLDVTKDRPWSGGKGVELGGPHGEEATDFGQIALFKRQHGAASRVEVDPASGERSGEGDESAALIQQYKAQVKKLEGELAHYQLRVAGVTALVNMLNDKKEEANQWREKSERLETALSRVEHKAGKLERELRDRNAGGDETGRRMAPVLPPNKQILNKLARENAQLKMALNRLMGKGIYSYQEGLNISDLERVIEEQAQSIKLLQNQIQKLREGYGGTQTHPSDRLPDSGIGPSMNFTSMSAPASLSGTSPEVASLKSEVLSMEEKLLKRERFIVTLAEKLAEYQAKDRQLQHGPSVLPRSLPVAMEMERGQEDSQKQYRKEDRQESTDSTGEADAKIRHLEEELAQSNHTVEELSAQLSVTNGELEEARRKCNLAEEEVKSIRERAQIHFGTDVERYTSEISGLRQLVGRLSKQANEQKKQIMDRDEELKQFRTDPAVIAKDQTVAQLREENDRLRRDIEEADIKLKSLKSDRDSVDELREKVDELDSLVRKLRMEKRMVTSQYNDAKASHEAALAQCAYLLEVVRQANVYDPRSQMRLTRQTDRLASSTGAITDSLTGRMGGNRSEYPSQLQTTHARFVEARGIHQPTDSTPHCPSPAGHVRPPYPTPPQQRPFLVSHSQQHLSSQESRYTMASREQYVAGSRESLSLTLGMGSQYAPSSSVQSRPPGGAYYTEGALATPPMPFGRAAHFAMQDTSGQGSGSMTHVRSGAGSPNTSSRFVAERDHSGSGSTPYEAPSRSTSHHRQ